MTASNTLPNRPAITVFGAPFVNFDEVEDPETEQSADQINTELANVTALCGVSPLAVLTISALGAITGFRSVWGTDSGVQPVITNPATGNWLLTWPSTLATLHPTDTAAQAVSFLGGVASSTSATPLVTSVTAASNIVNVYIKTDASVSVNSAVLVVLYLWPSAHGAVRSRDALAAVARARSPTSTSRSKRRARRSCRPREALSRSRTSSWRA